jgi:phosphoribosyl 1,2-cyclic phosphodiesterase/ActR/RegA family two-component response regulator
MKVRFWGTRGSIATPGSGTNHYGGNTSCIEVLTDSGVRFILDCGTGARPLGAALAEEAARPIFANILLSHTHWDHIQGFPFFAPIFIPGSRIAAYAPKGSGASLSKVLAGQMEFTYFPVELNQLPAEITYHDLAEGAHQIADVRVIAQYLNHPAATLGYRIEADGAAVMYLCDHEPFSENLWRSDGVPGRIDSILHAGDRRHAQFMAGADFVIHDAQYTPEEYSAKRNWGHSTFRYVIELAGAAGVRKLALTHHDPMHDDAFLQEMERRASAEASLRAPGMDVHVAREGWEVDVESVAEPHDGPSVAAASPTGGVRVLLADDDDQLREVARTALARDGHIVIEARDGGEALRLARQESPDVIVLDVLMPEMDGLEVLGALRAEAATARTPVLLFTTLDNEGLIREGFSLGATDYLTKPFTMPQLTARVRTCLARAASTGS